jgi:hypothetical protein
MPIMGTKATPVANGDHRTLRGLAVAYGLYQASWGILLVAVPVLIIRELGAGSTSDSLTATLWAIAGVAGGLGSLWAGHVQTENRERLLIAIGALAIYPVSVSLGVAGLAIGLALIGLLAGPIDVAVLSLRQRRTDAAWFGRVLSISMSLNMAGLPLGSVLGGLLLALSLPLAFVLSAAAAIAAYWLIPLRVDEAMTGGRSHGHQTPIAETCAVSVEQPLMLMVPETESNWRSEG